ncbi:GNAT family N-acetyltransferase [uncultured Jatrophihabitans sp.]|uniref:GNAT family N-acetyltransferase n=1 Tax=uncultured Jatrophihabitans sp. TaxID=1610747 RepID=UPI0035C9D80B
MSVEIDARPYDHPDVTRMVDAVQAEYVVMYGGPDAAMIDPGEFVPPAGLLLVGSLDGSAVAMAGWRRLSPRVAEVKRMYVDPRVRGRGLSRVMLESAERSALEAGVEEFVLNTAPLQRAAIALYESSGYVPGTPFGHYADNSGALFYAKRLRADNEARSPQRTGLVDER